MKLDRTRKAIAASVATGILSAGIIVPAFAQDAETETETEAPEDLRSARENVFAEALAEELGLDAETVGAAIDAVRAELQTEREAERRAALEERLEEAVADGELTREQADALLEAQDAGVLPFGGRGGRGGHHHGPGRFPVSPDTHVTESASSGTAA